MSSLASRQAGEQIEHVADALFLRVAGHHLGDGDGAGVDHGIERAVGDLVEHDGVERLAGGLDAHMLEHGGAAMALERVAVHEGLGHRLDGEGDVGIPHLVDLPVHRGDGDAEQGGIDLAELRDVVGRTAAGDLGHACMQVGEERLHGRGELSLRRTPDRDPFCSSCPPRATAAPAEL